MGRPQTRAGETGWPEVIYYHFAEDMQIWLLTVYGKDEAADLTAKERRLLKAALEEEKQQRARVRAMRRK